MITKAVSNRRLLRLADFLDVLPRKRFDYHQWVGWDWKGDPNLSCGTKACALGWAATMPTFRRLGLHLVSGRHRGSVIVNLKLRARDALSAGMVTFGLTREDAVYLFLGRDYFGRFHPVGNATPKQVARHIRRFVRSRT